MRYTAGRLIIEYYEPKDGDAVVIKQTHANGSDDVGGKIRMKGEDIHDMWYLVDRVRTEREKL